MKSKLLLALLVMFACVVVGCKAADPAAGSGKSDSTDKMMKKAGSDD